MNNIDVDIAIIGGGPAGLAAAIAAKENGAGSVAIIERDATLGGILQQCIHPGFGLSLFKEELTGPEYAGRFTDKLIDSGISVLTGTMVIELTPHTLTCVSKERGILTINAKATILAMGCRERTRGNILIPGDRPKGVFTAGTAQRLVNRQNVKVGDKVVILGSGDIGMIMARRMTLEGAKVLAVVEIMSYLSGLARNKAQCLDDFGIPLMLSHTITRIAGKRKLEGVYIAEVDQNRRPIAETEQYIVCDTLLLSVGLIPENELSKSAQVQLSGITGGAIVNQYMQTNIDSIFACGNVLHVNDLVDNVSTESKQAGEYAALYVQGKLPPAERVIDIEAGSGIRYICPQRLSLPSLTPDAALYMRVTSPARNAALTATDGETQLQSIKRPRISPGEMEHIKIKDVNALSQLKLEIKEGK